MSKLNRESNSLLSKGRCHEVTKGLFPAIRNTQSVTQNIMKTSIFTIILLVLSLYLASQDGNIEDVSRNTIHEIIQTKGSGGSNSLYSDSTLISFWAVGDNATDNIASLNNAFQYVDVLFVNKTSNESIYKFTGTFTIPYGKKLIGIGGVLDGGTIDFKTAYLDGGAFQIFSYTTKITGKPVYTAAYPEWFGANRYDNLPDAASINKTLNEFNIVHFGNGGKYLINDTLKPPMYSRMIGNYAQFRPTDDYYNTIIYWTKPLCSVEDLIISIPNYRLRSEPDNKASAYTDWVIQHDMDYSNQWGREYRQPFILRNVTIRETGPYIAPADWTPDVRYDGFRIACQNAADLGYAAESYFGDVYNLKVEYGYDTAVFIDDDISVPDTRNSHPNSWYFTNCKFDYGLTSIVIQARARGHRFANTMIQTYYSNPIEDYQRAPAIDITGFGNRIDVSFEDEFNKDSTIVFRETSYKNLITTSNPYLKTYVWDYNDSELHKRQNVVAPNSWFMAMNSAGEIAPVVPLSDWTFTNDIIVKGKTFLNDKTKIDVYNRLPFEVVRKVNSTQRVHQSAAFVVKSRMSDGLFGKTNNFGGQISFRIGGRTSDIELAWLRWIKTKSNKAGDNQGALLFGVSGAERMRIASNGDVSLSSGLDVAGKATIGDILKLTPQSTAPVTPAEGTVYVNSTDRHIYIYLNSTWKQLDN